MKTIPLLTSLVLTLFFSAISAEGIPVDLPYNPVGRSAQSEQSLRLLESIRRNPDRFDAYQLLLQHYLVADDIRSAKRVFRRMAQQKTTQPYAWWMLAKLHEIDNRPDQANRFYRLALSTNMSSRQLAVDYLDFDQKCNRRYRALDFLQHCKADPDFAHFSAAYAQFLLGHYQAADSLFQLAGGDELELLHYRGKNLTYLSRYPQADSLFRKGLALAVEQKNQRFETLFYCDCFQTCPPEEEQQWIERARKSAAALGDTLLMSVVFKYQAYLDRQNGRHAAAAALFATAAATADKFSQTREAAELYFQLAETLYRVYSLAEALAAAEKCYDLSSRYHDLYHQAAAQEMLGKIYDAYHIPKLAKLYYHQALGMAECMGQKDRVQRLQTYLQEVDAPETGDLSRYRRRIAYYQQRSDSLAVLAPLLELGHAYLHRGQADSALAADRQALLLAEKFGRKNQEAWALLGVAGAYLALGDLAKAEPACRRALLLADELGSPRIALWIYAQMGFYYFSRNEYEEAARHLTQAAELTEKLRTESFAEELRVEFLARDRWQIYEKLTECHYRLYQSSKDKDLEQVFALLEMMRARSLKDRRPPAAAQSQSAVEQEYAEACRRLRQQQAQLREWRDGDPAKPEELLQEIEFEKQRVIASRIKAYQQLRAVPFEQALPTLSQLQKQLGDISVLMYHIGDESAFALALDRHQVAAIDLPIKRSFLIAQIDSLILPLHQVDAAGVKSTPFHADIAYRLYQQLLAPIKAQIDLRDNVGIVACEELAALPFELLLTQPPSRAVYAPTDKPVYADSFLAQYYSISYAPSALFFQKPERTASRSKMLIVANPMTQTVSSMSDEVTLRLRTGWRFDPLIFAELEGKRIKQLHRQARMFKRKNAAESRIKRLIGRQSIVHFASHAYVDTSFDAFSGLMLVRDDDQDDGILMGFEIGELNLNCDLVTLSACETGRGKVVRGEGVMGLPRQWLYAGAASVIMSHWKVDDQFTSNFMPRFYRHYFRGESKTLALRHARNEILAEKQPAADVYHQHPFFWAAFSLYGQPERTTDAAFPPILWFLTAGLVMPILVYGIIRAIGRRR